MKALTLMALLATRNGEIDAEVRAELIGIADAERSKALEKYGPEAVQPGGRPEFDILDFSVREVVGLDRYGEMLENRFAGDAELVHASALMRAFSAEVAPILAGARLRLQQLGFDLGVPERERFSLPDNAHASRPALITRNVEPYTRQGAADGYRPDPLTIAPQEGNVF